MDVNGAYLELVGYRRGELIGHPIGDFLVGGPRRSQRQWLRTIARGEFTGEAPLLRADGSTVVVQYAGHTEVVTGHRRVLFVALSTSRSGRHARREGEDGALGALSAREQDIVAWSRPRHPPLPVRGASREAVGRAGWRPFSPRFPGGSGPGCAVRP